jgi:membrane-associated phospholipid phosphatase
MAQTPLTGQAGRSPDGPTHLATAAAPAPPSLRTPLGRIARAAATCAVLVALVAWLIDRPVATWSHAHLGDRQFDWFTGVYRGSELPIGPFSFMVAPAEALGPVAILVMLMMALAAAAGVRLRQRGRIAMALSVSVLFAAEFNGLVKLGFGRTWPESWLGDNPSWIRDGVFGFFPFHGGAGFASFPSGHTTVITAPATILWIVWPELRVLWAGIVAVVAAGLIGANYHFVSDIIGGLYLGAAVGHAMALIMLSGGDRLSWSTLWSPPRPTAPPPPADRPCCDPDA